MGLALLFHSHVPTSYWVDVFSTATYIIRRLPTPFLGNISAFEVLYGKVPQYISFHPFGCRVFPVCVTTPLINILPAVILAFS